MQSRDEQPVIDAVDCGMPDPVGLGRGLPGGMTQRTADCVVASNLYRRNRPSASGLDPEGEGRKPR